MGGAQGHRQVSVERVDSGARLPGVGAPPLLSGVNDCGYVVSPTCASVSSPEETGIIQVHHFKTLKAPKAKNYICNMSGNKT